MFLFFPVTSGPVAEHFQKKLGSVLFTTSLQVFIHTDVISVSLLFPG